MAQGAPRKPSTSVLLTDMVRTTTEQFNYDFIRLQRREI